MDNWGRLINIEVLLEVWEELEPDFKENRGKNWETDQGKIRQDFGEE
jgi:hypothetical protein